MTNMVQESMAVEEVIMLMADDDNGQYFNYDTFDVTDSMAIDECVSYYDWVADTGTTSHIMNRHDAFVTYQPLTDKTVWSRRLKNYGRRHRDC